MNLSKLLSLYLFGAFVANDQHQVLGACAKKKITIQQQSSSPHTTTPVSEARTVARHYGFTGGSYTGNLTVGGGQCDTFLHLDTGTCVYSLVNVLGKTSTPGDVTLTIVPGSLGNLKVRDGGVYTYSPSIKTLTSKWSFKSTQTEGFAHAFLPYKDGCTTVQPTFTAGTSNWMWWEENSRISLTKNVNLEICFEADGGGNSGGDPQPSDPPDICEQGCGFLNIFCWISFVFQCILS